MPYMRAPYASEIRSLSGHILVAKENEILHVPSEVKHEAIAIGWQPATAPEEAVEAPKVLSDNVVISPDPDEEMFEVELDQAVLRVITRNVEEDFKNNGVPKLNVVVAEMSPDVKKPTAGQVLESYTRLQDNIDLAEAG